ncbi:thyrotropin-releasing hormone receptor-like [Mizuhopecten yessoensis]|uniref:thyrotropin-releasing hormone receptor-like n=1 Tax=Mizuhopecten yessoensis TaxID=6573 RepID=UPI000B45C570|nr:thyrotropin-releasing hormone receptor-like [Mizuhopecten yessoensis]
MSEPLPVGDFRWTENADKFDVLSIPKEGDLGYILEVDLEVSESDHDLMSDYPMAPERKTVSDEELSPTSKALWRELYPSNEHTESKLHGRIDATTVSMNSSTETPVVNTSLSSAILFNNMTTDFNTTTAASANSAPSIYDYGEYWAALYINKYYLYVIVAIGLPGNLAAVVTICNMRPLTSSSVYMVMLAIVDSVNLGLKILYLQLTLYNVQMGHAGCKVMFFCGTFFMHYANWILVAMTIERFLAIWLPLKVSELCTRTRAFLVMGLIAVPLLGLNLHFFWSTLEVWDDYYSWDCQFRSEFEYFMTKMWYWIDGAAYSLIPFIILVIFNILIIVGISRGHRGVVSKIDKTQMTEKMKQQQQITIMLVTVSLVFVVLTMPNCVFFIFQNYWDYTKNLHEYARYFLFYQLVFVLSDFNHAINFYLYFLSGRKFRARFHAIICICRRKQISRRLGTTISHIASSRMSATEMTNGYSRRPPERKVFNENSRGSSPNTIGTENRTVQKLNNICESKNDKGKLTENEYM